jgi:hypothetical protein
MTTQNKTPGARTGATGGLREENHRHSQNTPKPSYLQDLHVVETAVAEIERAHGRDETKADRAYHKGVANNLSRWLADDYLKVRKRIPNEPRGQRVPPTMGDIHIMADGQRRLASAQAVAELWKEAMFAAMRADDPSWEQCNWGLIRAELVVDEIEREVWPWK